MMLSLPSFLAAAMRAAMPPISAADLALAALVVELEVVCPHAVSRTRAPARMLRRRATPLIPVPPRAGRPPARKSRRRSQTYSMFPSLQSRASVFPPFNHPPDGLSRSGRSSLATVDAGAELMLGRVCRLRELQHEVERGAQRDPKEGA